jgi:hypothetical protein
MRDWLSASILRMGWRGCERGPSKQGNNQFLQFHGDSSSIQCAMRPAARKKASTRVKSLWIRAKVTSRVSHLSES